MASADSSLMESSLIPVKVIPRAKGNKVKKEDAGFKVYLTAPPIDGKANKLLIKLLADYFSCKKQQIKILKGRRSKNKLIQLTKAV